MRQIARNVFIFARKSVRLVRILPRTLALSLALTLALSLLIRVIGSRRQSRFRRWRSYVYRTWIAVLRAEVTSGDEVISVDLGFRFAAGICGIVSGRAYRSGDDGIRFGKRCTRKVLMDPVHAVHPDPYGS